MKIRPVGAELVHANGLTVKETDRWKKRQRDIKKLTITFHNFVNALKIILRLLTYIVLISILEMLTIAKTGTARAYFEISNCHVLSLEFSTLILSPKSPSILFKYF
jgi:hypothetical protein